MKYKAHAVRMPVGRLDVLRAGEPPILLLRFICPTVRCLPRGPRFTEPPPSEVTTKRFGKSSPEPGKFLPIVTARKCVADDL